MSVYAASPRCSSFRQCNLSSRYSHSFCQTCNFSLRKMPSTALYSCPITLMHSYTFWQRPHHLRHLLLLQLFADTGQMSSSTMMVSASIFTYIELLAYIPDFQISIQQLSHFSLRNMPTSSDYTDAFLYFLAASLDPKSYVHIAL